VTKIKSLLFRSYSKHWNFLDSETDQWNVSISNIGEVEVFVLVHFTNKLSLCAVLRKLFYFKFLKLSHKICALFFSAWMWKEGHSYYVCYIMLCTSNVGYECRKKKYWTACVMPVFYRYHIFINFAVISLPYFATCNPENMYIKQTEMW